MTDRIDSAAVDLVVPAQMDVGEMMPSVVDLVGAKPASDRAGFAGLWTLSKVGGPALDESMTLHENGIRDGDLLMLAIDQPPVPSPVTDLTQRVAGEAPPEHDVRLSRRLGVSTWWWSLGFGAAALAWPSRITQDHRAITAVIVAIVATVASITAVRIDVGTAVILSVGAAAVLFGAMAGFLIVPGGPAPPNFFLAAVICCAIAIVLLRVTGRGLTMYTAMTATSLMVAVVLAAATIWPIPMATLGAALAAASVATQGLAAKMSVLLAGLSPPPPDAAHDDAILPAAEAIRRANDGHRILTGLLAGLSLSGALGTVLVVADPDDSGDFRRLVFVGVVMVALAFRASQQRGTLRLTSMLSAVLITATAAFTHLLARAPETAGVLCVIAVGAGACAMWLPHTEVGSRLSPLARRGIEVVDYLALAAVVPAAFWVSGVFGVVRGLSLS